MDQKMLQEAAALQQYTTQLEEQYELMMRQIAELEQFTEYLKVFESKKDNSTSRILESGLKFSSVLKNQKPMVLDMYANVGKGVYLKSERKSENFLVEVSSGILVEKTPAELKEVIEEQLNRLKESHVSLTTEIGFYAQRLQDIMAELEQQEKSVK